jgi:hypothetical protein
VESFPYTQANEYFAVLLLSRTSTVTVIHSATLETEIKFMFVRSEVFTAATTKNDVFWDIKTKFVPQRKDTMHRAACVGC